MFSVLWPIQAISFLAVASIACFVYKRLSSPLRRLAGPAPASFLKGNFGQLFDINGWDFHHNIVEKYGAAVKLYGLLGDEQVYVSDPKALNHIVLKDQAIYEETANFLTTNAVCLGLGLTATLGDHHRRQRKMINPVFSINHMRALTPLFYRVTRQLREKFFDKVKDGPQEINMLDWMSRTALECIGQGGLGYSFHSLDEGSTNPYSDSVKGFAPVLFSLSILRQFLPFLSKIGTPRFRRWVVEIAPLKRVQRLREIVDIMDKTSSTVFEQKKRALAEGDKKVVHQIGEGKDVMSILLQENVKASAEDRLSDAELLGQMSTLIFAAADTTSTALARILHMLVLHPDAQERLRNEVTEARDAHGDLEYDDLIALPYLDAVCRETLRLHPPVVMLHRTTRADIVLPLSKPVIGSDGYTPIQEIPLRSNTNVIIGIQAANRNPDIWGPDALEWKPERWLKPLPDSVGAARLPGVYSSMMTFLGGGRACIGFKFSQLEMKVVLSVLLESFRFEASDKEIFWRLSGIVSPGIAADKAGPGQLPMRVSRLK